MTRRIEDERDIAEALAALTARDARLAPVAAAVGPVKLRRRPAGFQGLAATIVSQQVSTTAANAIWSRLSMLVVPFTPEAFLSHDEEALRAAGLSRGKVKTLTALAQAARAGFDFDGLAVLGAEEAIAKLTALHGIGRWTAEIYLLFCLGHADIFPAGDLALQKAAAEALGLAERPDDKSLRAIAEDWRPWRGVAAKLLWAYYNRPPTDAAGEDAKRASSQE